MATHTSNPASSCLARAVLACAAIPLAGLAIAQQPAAPPAQAPVQAPVQASAPDPVGTGRYPAMKEEVASLPQHVVYRPKDLARLGGHKLGVVAWGNGGCSDDGASSRFHLLELASHGYLVIANGRILSGPGAPPAEPRPPVAPGQLPPARNKAADLIAAIDWALQENARQGSPYFGRIDPRQIAVSGWSCGGVQAIRAGADPRVRTLVLQNTGILNNPGQVPIPEMNLGKDALQAIHTPTLYILGGPKDIAYENGMDDFRRIDHVPVAVANLPVGHGGTYLEPNGGKAAQVAASWLDWQLKGDTQAARRFTGKDCGLCKDHAWTFERRNFTMAPPPKGYVFAEMDVQDAEAFKAYAAQTPPILAKYGGIYLVRGGKTVTLEGAPPASRVVVIEFPSVAAARGFEESPEYTQIVSIRHKAATSRSFIAEGVAPAALTP